MGALMPPPGRAAVSLVRVPPVSDGAAVRDRVEEALALLGSPLDAVGRGDLVLIKPNMFQRKPGFLTSPDVVAAVAAAAAARGARVVVAERTRAIYDLLAGTDVGRYAEVTSFDDQPLRITDIPAATSLRVPIAVPEIVLDCDYFIGTPHLRSHSTVVLTGALKNLVGLLPGYTTRIVHMAGALESLVDLNLMRPQHLVVADARTVVEGNYPMGGTVREVGVLAAGTNAVAVDTVLAELSGVDPAELDYLTDAGRRGLGPNRLEAIELRGTPLPEVCFTLERAPVRVAAPRAGIHLHTETACPACRRWVAAALEALRDDLAGYPGEVTIVAGAREELPELRGTVVLVGNALYEHRDAGVYLEGCPPRAIQIAAVRHALGMPVNAMERTQFRVPDGPDALAGTAVGSC
jgi:uncharacterized protein (DUF362 family)